YLGAFHFDKYKLRAALGGAEIPPLLRELVAPAARKSKGVSNLVGQLRKLRPEQKQAHLQAALQAEAARVLGLASASDVPPERPLRDLGLDSLMAIELRNGVVKRVGFSLPATLVFDYPTVQRQAVYVLERMVGVADEAPVAKGNPPESTPPASAP